MSDVIKLTKVRKTFDGKEFVLNNLNLNIKKGKITTIIGFSGTGKSVTLKHLLGLLKPTSGQIEVLGCQLLDASTKEMIQIRKKFGVLFQNAALFDDMSVMGNVLFPLNEHKKRFKMR